MFSISFACTLVLFMDKQLSGKWSRSSGQFICLKLSVNQAGQFVFVLLCFFCLLTSLRTLMFLPLFIPSPVLNDKYIHPAVQKQRAIRKTIWSRNCYSFFDFPLLHEVSWKRCRDLLSAIILNWLYLVYNLVSSGNIFNKHLSILDLLISFF